MGLCKGCVLAVIMLSLQCKGFISSPEIIQSGPLTVGQNVTLTCIPPGNCFGANPAIIWRKSDVNGIWGKSSTLTFVPKPTDHEKTVTCELLSPRERPYAEKELDVQFIDGQFSIDVPNKVVVKENQDVTIPCTFIADFENTFSNIRGFWMKSYWEAAAYSKDAPIKYGRPRPNFHFTGDLNTGNCALTITDARKENSGSYYFRIEGPLPYSYKEKPVYVSVRDSSYEPDMLSPSGSSCLDYNAIVGVIVVLFPLAVGLF